MDESSTALLLVLSPSSPPLLSIASLAISSNSSTVLQLNVFTTFSAVSLGNPNVSVNSFTTASAPILSSLSNITHVGAKISSGTSLIVNIDCMTFLEFTLIPTSALVIPQLLKNSTAALNNSTPAVISLHPIISMFH